MKLKHIFFLLFIFGCAQLPHKRTDKLSILQGLTNSKEVEFSILASAKRSIRFELRSAEGEILAPDEMRTIGREHSPYVIHKILFSRDQLKEYNLFAFEVEQLVDQRLVGKGPLNSSQMKLAIASSMNDAQPQNHQIWDDLLRKNPDYLLLIGDNVYVDRTSGGKELDDVDPEIIWDRYVDARFSLPLYFQQKLIPTHAIWDDHDYGPNNSNADFLHKEAAKEIFSVFWAQDLSEESWTKGFGAGGLLSLGDFNLYFLDGRSFRSSSDEGKHLGTEQEEWLLAKLREQPGPSFIIKGDQFFGGYHKGNSFEGNHPKNFTQFNGELGKIDTPFIFLSGDRHLSEVMQFPRGLFKKPSFEITSSPIQNEISSSSEDKNPWRVVVEKENQNFIIINNMARDNHWFLDVESIGLNGNVFFRRELAVYIKDLQDNLQVVRKKRRRSGRRRYKRIHRKR